MSIDKWLFDETSEEERKKREELYKNLPKEDKLQLKKKGIQELIQKKIIKKSSKHGSEAFLKEVLKFKEWLNQRTYLRGDLEKLEIWINNLYKFKFENSKTLKKAQDMDIDIIKKEYNKIPPSFLDENTRLAMNKKLRNVGRTSSDDYYLRKLKGIIKEKLKEAEYYEILKKILRFKVY